MIKQMALQYFEARELRHVDLELGEAYRERSVLVHGPITEIIRDLYELFRNFDIERTRQTAHIDLRGNSTAVVQTRAVPLIDNFTY